VLARRCRRCWEPLRALARSDAVFCSRACKAAAALYDRPACRQKAYRARRAAERAREAVTAPSGVTAPGTRSGALASADT
jgi:hypothetical protein